MYCNECGNRLREGARFCDDCGAKVVSEEEKNSEVTTKNEVADNTVQLAEEPKESWNDTKEVKKHSANNRNGVIYLGLMTISIIWLALSGFMPIVYERIGLASIRLCFWEMFPLRLYYDFGVMMIIARLCHILYIAGIIMVLAYFTKLLPKCKDCNKICKLSLIATILLAIPTIFIYILVLVNIYYIFITPIGWITIAVMVINIIVTLIFMKMNRKKKHNKESESKSMFSVYTKY